MARATLDTSVEGYTGSTEPVYRWFVVDPGTTPLYGRLAWVYTPDCTAGFIIGHINYIGIPWSQIAPAGCTMDRWTHVCAGVVEPVAKLPGEIERREVIPGGLTIIKVDFSKVSA